jgi:hypothetical protein
VQVVEAVEGEIQEPLVLRIMEFLVYLDLLVVDLVVVVEKMVAEQVQEELEVLLEVIRVVVQQQAPFMVAGAVVVLVLQDCPVDHQLQNRQEEMVVQEYRLPSLDLQHLRVLAH